MKIISAVMAGEEEVFDLSVEHDDHSFQLACGPVAHNCGIIISNEPVQNIMPISYVGETKVTSFNPKAVELAGGIKYDILGLNTLQDITNCLRSIKERLGITIDINNLPDDKEVFEQFGKGNTATVFQFDTVTVRPFLTELKPKSIEELSGITALARPGTLDAPYGDGRTLAEVYVDRAKGEHINYVHEDLAPILSVTQGIQLYQEQTLQIFRDIGGLTYEEAEAVRRAIGKKDVKELDRVGRDLMNACLARGWSEMQARLLFDQIQASSKYSFNKSHSTSYAIISYICMYLKVKYPLDWWKAVLDNASKDEIATKFWPHVKNFVAFPDIKNPRHGFAIVGDKIVAPIGILKGIGEKAYAQIVNKAPYADLEDFLNKHFGPKAEGERGAVNSTHISTMAAAGLLDCFFGQDELVDDKLVKIEMLKAKVKGKKKPEPVDERFKGITELGRYVAKKQLIDFYSEDLRPLVMQSRGGVLINGSWYHKSFNEINKIYSAEELEETHILAKEHKLLLKEEDYIFGAVGYVISEKTFQYQNKTKQATKIIVDVGGYFYEEVIWPSYDGPEKQAPTGFDKNICQIWYEFSPRHGNIKVKTIAKLIDKNSVVGYHLK